MAKVVKTQSGLLKLEPMRNITRIHWAARGVLSVSAIALIGIGIVFDAASIAITVNGGRPWASASGGPFFPGLSYGAGNVATQSDLAAIFAPDPVPDIITFTCVGTWHVVGPGGTTGTAGLQAQATWFKTLDFLDTFEPPYIGDVTAASTGGGTTTFHSRVSTHHNFT